MYLVKDLMTREPVTLRPGDDLARAESMMLSAQIRHLPVVDGDQVLVGLVSHTDLLRVFAEHGLSRGRAALAEEVMTPVVTVTPQTSLHKALSTMLRYRFGCLPVVNRAGVLQGILTELDLVKFATHFVRDFDELEKRALDS